MNARKLSLTVLCALLLSCGEERITPADDNTPNLRPLTAQEVQLVESGNKFALDLTKRINAGEPGSFFISPLSVGYALGMTFNGAAGETKAGIKSALDFGDMPDDEVNKSFKNLTDQLTGMDKTMAMEIANSIWYKNTLTVKQAFAQTVKNYYDAGIRGLDFGDPASKDIINGWIEEKTHDKIKDMLDGIPDDAVMYLVNAIYFKADWTYQFDKKATKKEPFKLENGEETMADMMFSKGTKLSVFQTSKFLYIEIPYGNRQFTMTILLPNDGYRVDEVMEELTPQLLKDCSDQADSMN